MAVRLSDDHAWTNILFRVAVLGFGLATYLVGAVMLTFGTLVSVLYLGYRWLRDGVWYSHSLADVLADEDASGAWFLEAPMLIALPSAGGTLAVAGLTMFFSVSLVRKLRA